VERRDKIWGSMNPIVARISQWADEDPHAMLSLLTDADLRQQLHEAMKSLGCIDDSQDKNQSVA
jgi:hypothetical protein